MKSLILTLTLLTAPTAFAGNKELVTSFYHKAFTDHQPELAMQTYVGAKYVQHNPFVADGKQPFIDYFKEFFKTHPKSSIDIKRVIAEGDLVVLHVLSKADEKDPGRAVMDIFRVEGGKIVEHWDVSQPVADKPANKNSMF